MKTVEDTTFSNALNSIEGENTGYCFVSVQDLEDAADFVAPEGMIVLVEKDVYKRQPLDSTLALPFLECRDCGVEECINFAGLPGWVGCEMGMIF